VRLFGDSESIAVAEKHLDDLEASCDTKVLHMNGAAANHAPLETLAQLCGVTLRCERDKVVVLGMQDAVKKTVENLDHYMNDFENRPETSPPKASMMGNESSLGRSEESGGKGVNGMANACPTCGACPFCASCGHPIVFAWKQENAGLPAPARKQESAGLPGPVYDGGNFNPNPRGGNSNFAGGNSNGVVDTSAKMQPWIGQQAPIMTYDGNMAQVPAAQVPATQVPTHQSAVPGGMIQGMMPATFMIPANMIQYGVSQGGQEIKGMQTNARNATQAYYMNPMMFGPGSHAMNPMMPGVGA
jgi:hypothetical protein